MKLKSPLKHLQDQTIIHNTLLLGICKIKYELISRGIKVKTKIIRHNGVRSFVTLNKGGNEYYEIYIQSREMGKANKIIHNQ
ncbi:hypothetical protein [Clostridium moutaii]|uniref:hypothetical protein n=1 Tax=Clostridium moutaii TaxID=3240932 RepID=UPI003510013B